MLVFNIILPNIMVLLIVTNISLACMNNHIIVINICLTSQTKRTRTLRAKVHSVLILVATVFFERQFQCKERI